MGIFGFGKGKEVKTESAQPVTMIKLNLSKDESLINLDLRKDKVNLMCSKIPQLSGLKARVALVLDYSGSMSGEYRDGTVQSIVERIMPIASKFDDNSELDLWIFESGFKRLEGINMTNFYDYVKRDITSKYSMGGTRYAPVIEDIIRKYTVEEPSNLPTYIIFITDGDNDRDDKAPTTKLITEVSGQPIFWQFVGVGGASMQYLEDLDDMGGREIDNADFFRIKNINQTSDDYLYEKLFDEYPDWINVVRNKGLIR